MDDLEREWKNLANAQSILCLQNIRTNEQLAQKIWLNYQQYESIRSIWNKEVESNGEAWKKELLGHWWKWEDQVSIQAPLLKNHEATDRALREGLIDYDKLIFNDKVFLNQLYWYSKSILNTPLRFENLTIVNGILENIETSLNVEVKFIKTDPQKVRKIEEEILYIFKDKNGFYTPFLGTKREDFLLASSINWSTSIEAPFMWAQR